MVTINFLGWEALVTENLFHNVTLIAVRNLSIGLTRWQSGTPMQLLLFASVHGPINACASVGLTRLFIGGSGFRSADHLLNLLIVRC